MALPPGETALLTLRLPGTIPAATARELAAELRHQQAAGTAGHRARKAFFARFDAVLDWAPSGARYFENERVAEALAGEILLQEEAGFVVYGFAILPNHAHLLLHLRSAQSCCRHVRPKLPPDAPFWQPGWLEVPILDETELARALTCVRGNARQAGLPARYQQWPYGPEEGSISQS